MAQTVTIHNTQQELDDYLNGTNSSLGNQITSPNAPKANNTFRFPDGTLAAMVTGADGKQAMMPVEGTQPTAQSSLPNQQWFNERIQPGMEAQNPQTNGDWLLGKAQSMGTSGALGLARGASKLGNFLSFGYIPTLEERIAKERNIPVEAVTKILNAGIDANPTTGKVSEIAGMTAPLIPLSALGGAAVGTGVNVARAGVPALADALGAERVLAPVMQGAKDTGLVQTAFWPTLGNVSKELMSRAPSALKAVFTSPTTYSTAGLGATAVGAQMNYNGQVPDYRAQEQAALKEKNTFTFDDGSMAQMVTGADGRQRLVPIQPAAGMPTANAPANGATPSASNSDALFQGVDPKAAAYAQYYGVPYDAMARHMSQNYGNVDFRWLARAAGVAPKAKDQVKVDQIAGQLVLDQMLQQAEAMKGADVPIETKQAMQREMIANLLALAKTNPSILSQLGVKQ